MRILITGSNGLLGQKLLHTLSTESFDLIGVDLGPESFVKDVDHLYVPLDLTSLKTNDKTIRRLNPQIIVHTAAMTTVDLCEQEKEKCWRINVTATDKVVTIANKIDAKIILISSDYVFDGEKGPYKEDDIPNPINYYGRSKLAAENLVRGTAKRWAIVRTIVLYGVGINVRSSFVTWLLDKLRNNKLVHIVNDQWGNTTLVDDLARGIERILLLEKTGIYHIGGRDFMTRYEFAQAVAELFDLDTRLINPVNTSDLRQPAKRPLKSGLDIEKAERDLFISFNDVKNSLTLYREQEQLMKNLHS